MNKFGETVTSKYWQLIRLEATGKTKVEAIISAKEFFQKQFSQLDIKGEVNDTAIQSQLLKLLDHASEVIPQQAENGNERLMAQICLRCFISSQIEQVCMQLERQFGEKHDFNCYDLFPFVLNDTLEDWRKKGVNKAHQSTYKPLSVEIIETFDPQKAKLSTWTIRLVKQNRELNIFLLEHGVYLISNWAILNDTTTKQLERILREFHHLTSAEIQQAADLLSSYHAIYRQDRRINRVKLKEKCKAPSQQQLERIAQLLNRKTEQILSPENVLSQLQELVDLLREYRIYVRSGKIFAEQSLDNQENNPEKLEKYLIQPESKDESQEIEFSQFYRQQFLICLKKSIQSVIQNRLSVLNRKNPLKAKQFLTALELFHCQGKSMADIAPLVNLTAQYQVTRLLKLKEFRADVRQSMLQKLQEYTLAKASQYVDIQQLQQLEQRIETVLDEQIAEVIQEAEVEASIANSSPGSLFAKHLCDYVKILS